MKSHIWCARGLIFVVLFLNLQCAIAFIFQPTSYARSFELTEAVGDITIQSLGILFVMWNVPYLFAFWQPVQNKRSLLEAIIMQAIGFIGETGLYVSVGREHYLLKQSLNRFILFDGGGLILLFGAGWAVVSLIRRCQKELS